MKNNNGNNNVRNRKIHLYGDINSERIKNVIHQIDDLCYEHPKNEIELYINSSGGCSSVGLAFYDYVKGLSKSGLNLKTIALGNVNSMAIILLLAGTKRTAGQNVSFFFHEYARTFKDTTLSCSELITLGKDMTKSQEKYIDIIFKHTRKDISKKEIREILKEGKWIHSKEALKMGLIHKIE